MRSTQAEALVGQSQEGRRRDSEQECKHRLGNEAGPNTAAVSLLGRQRIIIRALCRLR